MLARAVDVSQSAVSQHLRILKSVGLVSGERRGYHVHYSLDKKASSQCRDLVASLFSGTAPGETEPTKRKRISTRHSRPKTQ